MSSLGHFLSTLYLRWTSQKLLPESLSSVSHIIQPILGLIHLRAIPFEILRGGRTGKNPGRPPTHFYFLKCRQRSLLQTAFARQWLEWRFWFCHPQDLNGIALMYTLGPGLWVSMQASESLFILNELSGCTGKRFFEFSQLGRFFLLKPWKVSVHVKPAAFKWNAYTLRIFRPRNKRELDLQYMPMLGTDSPFALLSPVLGQKTRLWLGLSKYPFSVTENISPFFGSIQSPFALFRWTSKSMPTLYTQSVIYLSECRLDLSPNLSFYRV